jgi:hypothetical protein
VRGDVGRALGLEAVGSVLRVLEGHTTDIELISHVVRVFGVREDWVGGVQLSEVEWSWKVKSPIPRGYAVEKLGKCSAKTSRQKDRNAPETLRDWKKGGAPLSQETTEERRAKTK